MKNESDSELVDTFVKGWNEGSLTEDDPIMHKVHDMAPKIVSRWGWSDQLDDVVNDTLIKLARGEYRGEGSLDGYINHIILNLVRQLWRKEGRNRRSEMPVDCEDKRRFALEIESRLSDRTKRLLLRVPKAHQWFIEAIIGADGYLSERNAAALGNVKRNQVEKLKKELRRIWEEMEEEEADNLAKAKGAGD